MQASNRTQYCPPPPTHHIAGDLGPKGVGVAVQDGLHRRLPRALVGLVVAAAHAVAAVAVPPRRKALAVQLQAARVLAVAVTLAGSCRERLPGTAALAPGGGGQRRRGRRVQLGLTGREKILRHLGRGAAGAWHRAGGEEGSRGRGRTQEPHVSAVKEPRGVRPLNRLLYRRGYTLLVARRPMHSQ